MYLGVDIGGTKTLVAVLNDKGVIKESVRFPTPEKYDDFLTELAKARDGFSNQDYHATGIAVPGRLDRENGIGISLGNLPWKHFPIQTDCEKLLHCPVVIENDANLAAVSEAMLHKDHDTVLYVTISTGIGTGLVHNQRLDPALLDSEGGHILLPHKDKLVTWESFASGKAILHHFGKKAVEINDEASWKIIARNLSLGLYQNIIVMSPDLVIIGGSVGKFFNRYEKYLKQELKKYWTPLVPIPPVVAAQRPEEAVVYGCYDVAKQAYGNYH